MNKESSTVALFQFNKVSTPVNPTLKPSDLYLNSQVGDDGPLVSLQRLQGDLSDLGL